MLTKEVTYEILSRITAVNSLDGLLDLFGNQLEALGLTEGYLINLLDASGACLISRKIRYAAQFQSLEQVYLGHKYLLNDEYVNARAFKNRSIVRVNMENACEAEIDILRYWKADEIVAIPIVSSHNDAALPLGVIVLMKAGEPILEQQIASLQELIALFHNCLANWMRYAHLEEMHEQEKASVAGNERLLQFLDELNGLTSLAKIYDLFAAQIFRQMHFDIAGFSLLENDALSNSYVAIADPALRPIGEQWLQFMQETPFPNNPAASGAMYVFSRDEAIVFPDVQQVIHLQIAKHDQTILSILKTPRTLFISPIRHQKKPIGVFAFYSLTKPVKLSETDLQLLERLSSFLGTALTNSQIYAMSQKQNIEIGHLNQRLQEKVVKLAEQASTDELTGLFNFRTFEEELAKCLLESKRTSDKKDLSLLLIDIDHFKNFNDTYGHAAGNDVLAGVAHEITKLIRQTDMACRYGGEEFVVILPKCDLPGALLLAERIRSILEKHKFATCAGARAVTVSIGCAMARPDDTHQALFARADEALYQAKNSGRNQVCSA